MQKLRTYKTNMLAKDPIAELRAKDRRVKTAQARVTGKEGATTEGAKGMAGMRASKKKMRY